jgi:lysophospholipase L1-like esterase
MAVVQRRPRRLLPYAAMIAGGAVAGVAVLVAVEVVLRLLNVTPPGLRRDPFAGFSRTMPMFSLAQRTDGVRVYRVSPGRQLAATRRFKPNPHREFLADRPPDTFRIVVLGDSSAAGVPYGVEYAFSAWLAQRLALELPSTRIEVTNAAMPGYATRRLRMIAEELVAYAPDLVIVYNGHNEFAERRYYAHLVDMDPRLFRLREWLVSMRIWGFLAAMFGEQAINDDAPRIDLQNVDESREMFAVLDQRAGGTGYASQSEREYGAMLYRFNLEQIVRTLRGGGAQVMFLTLSQNFADWAPGASAHRPDLSPGERSTWEGIVADADRLRDQGDCAAALARYRDALAVDDQFADLHFRVANCARQLGSFEVARTHYRRASDLDQVPHGAPTSFNEILRSVAQADGALLVDVDAALTAASADGLVGDDLFADWVHPNIRAHQAIAAAIADAARQAGLPAPAASWSVGAYTDPDPESIYAQNPKLRLAEHLVRVGTCVLAHRGECALREMDAAIALEPDNAHFKTAREGLARSAKRWREAPETSALLAGQVVDPQDQEQHDPQQ